MYHQPPPVRRPPIAVHCPSGSVFVHLVATSSSSMSDSLSPGQCPSDSLVIPEVEEGKAQLGEDPGNGLCPLFCAPVIWPSFEGEAPMWWRPPTSGWALASIGILVAPLEGIHSFLCSQHQTNGLGACSMAIRTIHVIVATVSTVLPPWLQC